MTKRHGLILGISEGHGDSSAVILKDGVIVAAAEEERFNRIKHFAGFPQQAIDYCLKKAGATANDVDIIAIAKKPDPNRTKIATFLLRHPSVAFKKLARFNSRRNENDQRMQEAGLSLEKIRYFEHHLAHAASVRDAVPSSEVGILTFDGLGDFVSTMFSMAQGSTITPLDKIYFPHSLGYFYTAMTQFLGFPFFGDEFKVMGLSSLGQPTFIDKLSQVVYPTSDGFRLNHQFLPVSKLSDAFYIEGNQPYVGELYAKDKLQNLLGIPARDKSASLRKEHHNLAKSIQVHFELMANHLLEILYEKTKFDHLALAGGCAHNSVWVGKIVEQSHFKKVYTAPACHDAGIALGAVRLAYNEAITSSSSHWGLLGPDSSDFTDFDAESQDGFNKEFEDEASLIDFMVDELMRGKIIGLYHGRLEFGPRALGSRSIIVDPSQVDMKDKLNARVKHRESFRPFAASVLYDEQDNWFEDSFYSPHMEAVFQVKPSQVEKIPAVVHQDQSCRIQSVEKDKQPFYYSLIKAFAKKSGVPMLLNTSFNDSEPIVCSPFDAYQCFRGCDMDHLVIDGRVFSKDAFKLGKAI